MLIMASFTEWHTVVWIKAKIRGICLMEYVMCVLWFIATDCTAFVFLYQ